MFDVVRKGGRMRKIKFRAWNVMKNRMFFAEDQMVLLPEEMVDDYFANIHLIPMQFTGLLDRFGKEIYEGDIIQSCSETVNLMSGKNTGKFRTNNYEVRWEEDKGRWGRWHDNKFELLSGLDKLHMLKWYKVIGNIYENQNL